MKRMPLGIQNLREIISGGYVYVDKTQYIYSLLNEVKYYFLSRPRRFGKSLLLDTIAEAFSGDKELFKGLLLYGSGFGFEEHPVLRIDMSNIANETTGILKRSLVSSLKKRVEDEGLAIASEIPSAGWSVKSCILRLFTFLPHVPAACAYIPLVPLLKRRAFGWHGQP